MQDNKKTIVLRTLNSAGSGKFNTGHQAVQADLCKRCWSRRVDCNRDLQWLAKLLYPPEFKKISYYIALKSLECHADIKREASCLPQQKGWFFFLRMRVDDAIQQPLDVRWPSALETMERVSAKQLHSFAVIVKVLKDWTGIWKTGSKSASCGQCSDRSLNAPFATHGVVVWYLETEGLLAAVNRENVSNSHKNTRIGQSTFYKKSCGLMNHVTICICTW